MGLFFILLPDYFTHKLKVYIASSRFVRIVIVLQFL